MKKFKGLFSVMLIASMAIGIQLSTIGIAHAASNTDLSVDSRRNFANQAIELYVCNQGSTAVKEIVFDISNTNATQVDSFFSVPDTTASDYGSYNVSTSTWTGLLDGGQCFILIITIDETGNLGEQVTTTTSIVSSIHDVDDVVNVDTNTGNDSETLDPYTIALLPDIKTETRLLTSGAISATDNVEYQIDLSNIGQGTYFDENSFQYIFVLPEGSSFVSVADGEPGDLLNATSGNCVNYGRMGIEVPVPGADYFYGRQIVLCSLTLTSGNELPVGNAVYSFKVTLLAGADLAAGNANVMGLFQGNDAGTLDYQFKVMTGIQLIDTIVSEPNDNIVFLSYDPTALNATASLCPGQPAVSTDGTGCFRISFNKEIYEPFFDVTDIQITGSGSVDTLFKLGNNLWEVRIKNIEPNKTATISLLLGGIVDYSAVESQTQVLGINAIRYAVDAAPVASNSASGALANTGSETTSASFAFGMLLVGLSLVFASRKKVSIVK